MKLHANAALSLNGRRQLARRIVDQGWTLTEAAGAAGVSARCARKWAGRYRLEGELGLFDRSSAPSRIPHRTPAQRIETIAALRRLRFTGAEIAETLDMALSTVSGFLTGARDGSPRADRTRTSCSLRTRTPWRADPYRRQETRPHPGRRRQARSWRWPFALQPAPHRRRGRQTSDRRLGVRAYRDRRRDSPSLRRSPRRRESHPQQLASCAARSPSTNVTASRSSS